jgi:transposase
MRIHTNKTREDDNIFEGEYQVKLPASVVISKKDPAAILHTVFERMDWSVLQGCYSPLGRIEYPPRVLTELLVYGYMQRNPSSRGIERACKENLKYMFLLDGYPPPDHNTIARFRSKRFPHGMSGIMRWVVERLMELGEIDMVNVFIDGTKEEANANRYTFVWKKSVEKWKTKLQEKMKKELPGLLEGLEVKFHMPESVETRHLKELLKKLEAEKARTRTEFVHGAGKRKSGLQKAYEAAETWLERMKGYQESLRICGKRNSYSKTDPDATFMRMKEDHMKNGQLKPGYNVNVATCCEYIIGSYISPDCTDTKTLIPFMNQLRIYPIERVILDAGYESLDNYLYFSQPQVTAKLLVKPTNHEQKKHKKYKTDISRRENMAYDANSDTYTCANGKTLSVEKIRHGKTSSGFPMETTLYSCADCQGCPMKEKCIRGKSKTPLEERSKTLYVSKAFEEYRAKMETNVNTKLGKFLRVNRSIQAEATFAMVKEDMRFRRFLLRGNVKVEAEWTLMAIAYNILKLFHKMLTGRLGTSLAVPTGFLEDSA